MQDKEDSDPVRGVHINDFKKVLENSQSIELESVNGPVASAKRPWVIQREWMKDG